MIPKVWAFWQDKLMTLSRDSWSWSISYYLYSYMWVFFFGGRNNLYLRSMSPRDQINLYLGLYLRKTGSMISIVTERMNELSAMGVSWQLVLMTDGPYLSTVIINETLLYHWLHKWNVDRRLHRRNADHYFFRLLQQQILLVMISKVDDVND